MTTKYEDRCCLWSICFHSSLSPFPLLYIFTKHPQGIKDRADAVDKPVKNVGVLHFPEGLRSSFASAFLSSGSIPFPHCLSKLEAETRVSGDKFFPFLVLISLSLKHQKPLWRPEDVTEVMARIRSACPWAGPVFSLALSFFTDKGQVLSCAILCGSGQ